MIIKTLLAVTMLGVVSFFSYKAGTLKPAAVIEVPTYINSCPKTEELIKLDTELFKKYEEYDAKVVSILDFAYTRPEGDKFDGTGIYLTNETLNKFYRDNRILLKQRNDLLRTL